jgi:hypothetical protein
VHARCRTAPRLEPALRPLLVRYCSYRGEIRLLAFAGDLRGLVIENPCEHHSCVYQSHFTMRGHKAAPPLKCLSDSIPKCEEYAQMLSFGNSEHFFQQ